MSDMTVGGMSRPSGNVVGLPIRSGGAVALLDRPEDFKAFISPGRATTEFACDWRSDNRARLTEQFDYLADCKAFMRDRAKRTSFGNRADFPFLVGELHLTAFHQGTPHHLGLASLRVVTDTGVAFIVDAFQNIVELENMKFHGTGSGTTAESAAQTGLVTEFTTELNPNSTRGTGTTEEGPSANIYKTVGTNTYDATVAVTEHGVFSQAATGGGVMIDRSLFSAVNLISGDSLQTDYRLTCASGG